MNQLLDFDNVVYDANLVIYYCFKTEKTRIVEFTDKTHILTEFLIKNGINIRVPKFIIDEINRIDFSKKIEEMMSKGQLTNMPKDVGFFVKMKLELKVKNKFLQLQQKNWFLIDDYSPSVDSVDEIRKFFQNLSSHPKINDFLKLKRSISSVPSVEDMSLLLFSKEFSYPIITNDYDLSFFSYELIEENLSNRIFSLNELNIFNN